MFTLDLKVLKLSVVRKTKVGRVFPTLAVHMRTRNETALQFACVCPSQPLCHLNYGT